MSRQKSTESGFVFNPAWVHRVQFWQNVTVRQTSGERGMPRLGVDEDEKQFLVTHGFLEEKITKHPK